jgi:hypothetical protein
MRAIFLTKVVTKTRNRSRHDKEAALLMSTTLGWLNTSVPTLGEAGHVSLVGKREINCLETQAFEYAKETGDILEYPPTNENSWYKDWRSMNLRPNHSCCNTVWLNCILDKS